MTGFVALAPLIKPLIEQDWAKVPADIQALWKERISLFRWDELSPSQRIDLARQQDYQHDPATAAEHEAAFNLVTEVHDIQRQIRELELAPAHTAGDVIAKEDRLAQLRNKAASLDQRLKGARGGFLTHEPVASTEVEPLAVFEYPDEPLEPFGDAFPAHGNGGHLARNWGRFPTLTIQEVVALRFGISPFCVDEYLEQPNIGTMHIALWNSATEELARAVRAGLIKTAQPIGDNLEDAQLLTSSVARYFSERDRLKASRQQIADDANAEAADVAETETDVIEILSPSAALAEEPAYDPLPTEGIAVMFRLADNDDENLSIWRELAHKAKRNGLHGCRVAPGSGRKQSTFDPSKVGEWLVSKGKFSQAQVDRILLNNLPPRSAHLRDLAGL